MWKAIIKDGICCAIYGLGEKRVGVEFDETVKKERDARFIQLPHPSWGGAGKLRVLCVQDGRAASINDRAQFIRRANAGWIESLKTILNFGD